MSNPEWEALGIQIDHYDCEFKEINDTKWTRAGSTDGNSFDFLDQQPGTYQYRVRAVNDAGVASAWSTVTKSFLGLSELPADITGLSLQIINGQAHFGWDVHPDLDVKVGGTVRFRYVTTTNGAEWKNGIDIGKQVAGAANSVVLPLLSGTYMAKAVDSSGNESVNAALVSTTVPSLINFNFIVDNAQHPTFSGTKTNMIVDDDELDDPVLKLAPTLAWDSIPDTLDQWAVVDAVGGLNPAGTYEFDDYMDLGIKNVYRLTPTFTFTVGDTTDFMDQRTAKCDTWKDWDDNGKDMTDVVAQIYVATTDDDPSGTPTWSAWSKITVGDYDARAFKFKVEVSTAELSHQIYITELNVTCDTPDRTEWIKGITSGTGVYSFAYTKQFYVEPSVAITAQDMDSGDYYRITNSDTSGFDIQFFDSGNNGISRTFNVFARGY